MPSWAWWAIGGLAAFFLARRRSARGYFAGGAVLDTLEGPGVALGVGLSSSSRRSADDEEDEPGGLTFLGGSSGDRFELPSFAGQEEYHGDTGDQGGPAPQQQQVISSGGSDTTPITYGAPGSPSDPKNTLTPPSSGGGGTTQLPPAPKINPPPTL